MRRILWAAARLAICLTALGATSAFAASYTFNLTNLTRTTSGLGLPLFVGSNEDPLVQIQLTALATSSNTGSVVVITPEGTGVDNGQGGGNLGLDDIEGGAGAEALIITPLIGTGPFTIESITFTRTETLNGGDQARVYLDNTAIVNCTAGNNCTNVEIGSGLVQDGGTFNWVPTANSQQFNTNITFRNDDGNDDYRLSQIVLDINTAAVPEPSTWTLFGVGVAALAWFRRKRK